MTGIDGFEAMKQLILNITTYLKLGENLTRVGAIAYSGQASVPIQLDDSFDYHTFAASLEALPLGGGDADTSYVIQNTIDVFKNGFGARSSSVHLAIYLTTNPSGDVENEALTAIQDGVTFYAVGIGVGVDGIINITRNDTSRVYAVDSFQDLDSLALEMGLRFSECCKYLLVTYLNT